MVKVSTVSLIVETQGPPGSPCAARRPLTYRKLPGRKFVDLDYRCDERGAEVLRAVPAALVTKSDIRRTEQAYIKERWFPTFAAPAMMVCNMEASLYEPINVYKPVAPNIGIVDGPFEYLTVGGVKLPLPFTTRMTV